MHADRLPAVPRSGRLAVLLAGLLFAAVVAGCGGPSEREVKVEEEVVRERVIEQERAEFVSTVAEEADGHRRSLDELPFDLSWDLQLPAPVHASWMSPEIERLLMVQLVTGEVIGIDVYSGMTRFQTIPLPKPITLRPSVARETEHDPATGEKIIDERLYIISGDELFVFDCVYGQLIWRYHLGKNGPYGFQPSSGPFAMGLGENLRVYVGDWDGRVRVIARHQEKQRSYHAWQWNLLAVPTAQPTGFESLAYVGDRGGMMRCFGLDRELVWQFDARSPIEGSAMVRHQNVYFGARDGVLHVCNRLSGREKAALFLGAEIRSAPFAFHSEPTSIYVWTSNHPTLAGLQKIRTIDDRIRIEDVPEDEKAPLDVNRVDRDWFLEGFTNLVASSPDKLYLTRANSTVVVAIDRRTGEPDWHWDLNEGREGSGQVAHITYHHDPSDNIRSIITADHTGKLVVYRLFGHQ